MSAAGVTDALTLLGGFVLPLLLAVAFVEGWLVPQHLHSQVLSEADEWRSLAHRSVELGRKMDAAASQSGGIPGTKSFFASADEGRALWQCNYCGTYGKPGSCQSCGAPTGP